MAATERELIGPDKKKRPCGYCKQWFGVREMRVHRPRCPKNPNATKVGTPLPVQTW